MNKVVDFSKSLSELNIEECDGYEDALAILATNKDCDAVWYFVTKDLTPEHGSYHMDIPITGQDCDMSSGFEVYPCYQENRNKTDLKMCLFIDSTEIPVCSTIINACILYNEFKIRVSFIDTPFRIRLSYKRYIFSNYLRRRVRQVIISYHNILYSDGQAILNKVK